MNKPLEEMSRSELVIEERVLTSNLRGMLEGFSGGCALASVTLLNFFHIYTALGFALASAIAIVFASRMEKPLAD